MTLSLSFDPKQWRSLTAKQRYQLIEQILIRHQRFNTLTAEIDYCGFFANELSTSNPPCTVILGETGAGKTTLIQTWITSTGLTRQETPEGSIIPYLYVFVPAQATIKATASVFLETLGDPNAGRGTQWNMVGRLKKLIKECKVRIIFVDEFQHIVDKDTHHVLHAVADFLKDLINQTNVPMVLWSISTRPFPLIPPVWARKTWPIAFSMRPMGTWDILWKLFGVQQETRSKQSALR